MLTTLNHDEEDGFSYGEYNTGDKVRILFDYGTMPATFIDYHRGMCVVLGANDVRYDVYIHQLARAES